MFIVDREHLAMALNIPTKKLTYLLYRKKTENCYTSFEIPKKNGGRRVINTPNSELKEVQRKLADKLYEKQSRIWNAQNITPNISHGFEKKKSIISNAKIHRNKRFVLNIDLENFFASFHFGRVRGYFNKNENFKIPLDVATVIAQLSCYNGSLPQGAPTSPVITNLICQILDFRLLNIAKKHKLDYTRYADDLTFSTNDKKFFENQSLFIKEISKVIEKAGFEINDNKTRFQYRDSRQTVTGLVVNKKINIDINYFRTTKAMAHSLYTKGQFFINGEEGTIAQLEGRFAFINQIDKYENTASKEKMRKVRTLNGREKEYQRFLFYKNFYNCSKPTIITEGKTDVLYIKAALKKYVDKYPSLIQSKSDGTFSYNITFLKRTKKLKYFFGLVEDGADTINMIYYHYTGKDGCKNCLNPFNKYNAESRNPVILVLDNEINGSDKKPIRKFQGYNDLSRESKEIFETNLSIKLINNANLYLITNPLVKEKTECEIEDLFSDETLATEIRGMKFSRKGETGFYGKVDFSIFVYNNYNEIDFSNFIPMLNHMNEIIETYSKS